MYFAFEQDRDEPDWKSVMAAQGIRMTTYTHLKGHVFITKSERDQYVKDFDGHPHYNIWAVPARRAGKMYDTGTIHVVTRHYPVRYCLIEPDWLKRRG